ncbi:MULTISPECIES: hypothetical protein [Bizionia]|uniref:Uncharacterized protein n=1 Tax=Bizionia algoritergicola TaxID=291187 RepID=A0A5D0R1L6_9FLAO|nr:MULTISPECIES: hypothetical protein [Bizionia]OBX20961.1 hypothetical protein BAA08_14580 [Bizionia sp. APA-3]TYB74588.1 hypothetical protein ES675_00140 [Bizionia algoritergicola]
MAFDSREYEWADLTLILGGQDITGIRAVKYSEAIEREALYAKGRFPHSIQSGNIAFKGEIAMLQSDYEALVKAGKGSVLSLNLDGMFSYGNPSAGDMLTSDRAVGIHFLEAAKDIKQGDKFQEIKLPFIFLKLKNQV